MEFYKLVYLLVDKFVEWVKECSQRKEHETILTKYFVILYVLNLH